MFIMNKDEVKHEIRKWPANVKQPIDRDVQIMLMKTAQQRREARINKFMKPLE